MRHFASLEANDGTHLVALSQKLLCLIDTGIEVMLLDTAGELYLLDLNDDLLFLGLLLALVTLEAELAVVDGTANGGCGVRNNENEVDVVAVCVRACFVDLQNTDLLVVLTDYANLGCFDLLVDQKILRVVGTNGSVPPKRKNAYRSLRTHLLHSSIIPIIKGRKGMNHTHPCGMVRTDVCLFYAGIIAQPPHFVKGF